MKVVITALILYYTTCYVQATAFTAYACEGQKMKLFCHPNEVIKVKSADYGRSNATICQFLEDADLDLNCHTKKAKQIVSERCDGKRKCLVGAINYSFGDPCPGQVKYLEATYRCQKKNTPKKIIPTTPVGIPDESNDVLSNIGGYNLDSLRNDRQPYEAILMNMKNNE